MWNRIFHADFVEDQGCRPKNRIQWRQIENPGKGQVQGLRTASRVQMIVTRGHSEYDSSFLELRIMGLPGLKAVYSVAPCRQARPFAPHLAQ